MRPQSLPLRARLFLVGVILGGGAALAAHAPALTHWTSGDVLAFACLVLASAASEQFSIPLHHGTETENYSITDGLWAGALLLGNGDVLVLAIAVGVVVGQSLRRWPLHKVAFNAGQFTVAMSAAVLVSRTIHPAPGPDAWVAAVAGMAAYLVVNSCTIALIIALVERKSFTRVFLLPLQLDVLHWAGNVAIGLLGALAWSRSPAAAALVVVPIALSYMAYRARLQSVWERDRMRFLYEAGRSLFGPLGSTLDLKPFLASVREMLEARDAAVVLAGPDRATVHGTDGEVLTLSAELGDGGELRPAELEREGLAPASAPIGTPPDVRGYLLVYRERGLSSNERSLLATLAWQLEVRMTNERLYEETEDQRGKLARIFENTSDGILLLTPDRVVASWNPGMERITGIAGSVAIGRSWNEVLGSDDDLRWLPDDGGITHDLPIIRTDGVPRWVTFTCNTIRGRDGEVEAAVVVVRDATAELEAEQARSDFVATISHELRTPLTPLKGFLSSLLSGSVVDTAEAREEYYRIMLKQTDRLEHLIGDLLETSRIEAASAQVTLDTVDLVGVVRGVVDGFRQGHPGRPIRLEGLPGTTYVRGDRDRIDRVLSNLLSNAVKYSPAEEAIDVEVDVDAVSATVRVRDRGPGIPDMERERIFRRFQRLETGRVRDSAGGTGLGLYIAKRLVEAMNGHIAVTSPPGGGSTFSFTLPAAPMAPGDGLPAHAMSSEARA